MTKQGIFERLAAALESMATSLRRAASPGFTRRWTQDRDVPVESWTVRNGYGDSCRFGLENLKKPCIVNFGKRMRFAGSVIRNSADRSAMVLAGKSMPRRSIAILLILAFLPIPGKSQFIGATLVYVPGVAGVVSFASVSGSLRTVPNFENVTENANSDDILWMTITESEITESESDEDGEVGRLDFACVFDRPHRSSGHHGSFGFRSFATSTRFSNPCEIFRVLRC